jgi:arylsulfatase A-like enzyme
MNAEYYRYISYLDAQVGRVLDDMHCQSLESFGGKVAGLTPNLDRFATEGMRFERAHVNVAICQPSRGVLATGRYGHNSGILGFMHTRRNIPTIMETLREAGYRTGILGKVDHSTPKADYRWDFVHDFAELGNGRSPQRYYGYCKQFFLPSAARRASRSTSWSIRTILTGRSTCRAKSTASRKSRRGPTPRRKSRCRASYPTCRASERS